MSNSVGDLVMTGDAIGLRFIFTAMESYGITNSVNYSYSDNIIVVR